MTHGVWLPQREGDPGAESRISGFDNYMRNVGYKTGRITCEFAIKTFNYDRGIRQRSGRAAERTWDESTM